jgi:hypothetical protein
MESERFRTTGIGLCTLTFVVVEFPAEVSSWFSSLIEGGIFCLDKLEKIL